MTPFCERRLITASGTVDKITTLLGCVNLYAVFAQTSSLLSCPTLLDDLFRNCFFLVQLLVNFLILFFEYLHWTPMVVLQICKGFGM